jgi:hypothetical protein
MNFLRGIVVVVLGIAGASASTVRAWMKLEDCLAQLQRARDVIRFSYIEALSHLEVAQRWAISQTNARVLRHRTLHALRECMSAPMCGGWYQQRSRQALEVCGL